MAEIGGGFWAGWGGLGSRVCEIPPHLFPHIARVKARQPAASSPPTDRAKLKQDAAAEECHEDA